MAMAQNTGRGAKPPEAVGFGITKPKPPGPSTSVWKTTASTSRERGSDGSARSIARKESTTTWRCSPSLNWYRPGPRAAVEAPSSSATSRGRSVPSAALTCAKASRKGAAPGCCGYGWKLSPSAAAIVPSRASEPANASRRTLRPSPSSSGSASAPTRTRIAGFARWTAAIAARASAP